MRKVQYVSSILFLALASALSAAPPTISSPERVFAEAGEWAEIRVETTGKWVKFRPLDTGLKLFPADKLKDNKTTLVYGKPGTRYRLLAYTGNEDGGAETEVIVVFGTAYDDETEPIPQPKPKPKPTPIPDVVLEDFWVIVVEETAERAKNPNIARVLGELAFWKGLPGAGARIYDKDSPDAIKYKYNELAKQTAIPLPVILLIDKNGDLIKATALPTDAMATSAIRAFVKTHTGK